jgi:hypothetical protein
MPPSSLRARLGRLSLAVGLVALGAGAAPALEVEVAREALPDAGPLVGEARLVLRGPRTLGGLSAILWYAPDRVLLASDRARLFTARLVRDEAGALVDLVEWTQRPVPLPSGWSDDTEGLALGDGQLLVSIEAAPHVVRFEGPPTAPAGVVSYFTRDELGFAPNAGFEALADLAGSDWLAIAETADATGHLAFTRDGGRLRYVAADGFAPTGADRVGDRLFVVERRISLLGGWQARIGCVEVAAVNADARLAPVEIARLGAADGIDNMEGIAVRADGADLEFLLVSDDNQTPFQRTVVLHYRWPGAASGGCRP